MHTMHTTHGRDRNPARNPNLSKASALLDLQLQRRRLEEGPVLWHAACLTLA